MLLLVMLQRVALSSASNVNILATIAILAFLTLLLVTLILVARLVWCRQPRDGDALEDELPRPRDKAAQHAMEVVHIAQLRRDRHAAAAVCGARAALGEVCQRLLNDS